MLVGLPLGLTAVAMVLLATTLRLFVLHDMHGHGPPSFFNKTDLSFNAGPNFIPNEFIKWSSVNNGSPEPSMLWSRKFCKETKGVH